MSFNIAVIGCGNIATGYHGPSYARYAERHPDVTLAACCDTDAARGHQFQQRFGFRRAYADFIRLLEEEQPDAVCLLAPPEVTCDLACAVLRRRFPLLMEKPPGKTVAEVDRIIAAANASGAPNQVAFNRRHMPLVRAALREMESLGQPVHHLRYDFTRIGRVDADFSTTAIHGIDTARFLAGSPYRQVRFHYQEFPTLGPAVANILMDCEFESGATAQLNFCPVTGVVIERATLHAIDHTIFVDLPIWDGFDSPGRLQHVHRGQVVLDLSGPEAAGSEESFVLSGFFGENASFFDDIRAGRRPVDDVTTARQSVEIAEYIRERKAEFR